jgi:hypothetical protein
MILLDNLFFLERTGEMRIISLIEEEFTQSTVKYIEVT